MQVDPAVAALLAARRWLERQAELDVQMEIAEGPLGRGALGEQVVLDDLAVLPRIHARTVEEDEGAVGRVRPFHRTLAGDAHETELDAVAVRARELAVGDVALPAGAGEGGLAVGGLGGGLDLGPAVPAVAGQAAGQEIDGELAVPVGDDLGGELVVGGGFADVLALDGEVGSGLVGVEEDLGRRFGAAKAAVSSKRRQRFIGGLAGAGGRWSVGLDIPDGGGIVNDCPALRWVGGATP